MNIIPTLWTVVFRRVAMALTCLGLSSFAPRALGQTPAHITVQPHDQSACIGANVGFHVEADGTPPINFHWTSNGVPVLGGVVSTPTNSTLTISNVQPFNNGDVFNVTAFNGFGPPDVSSNASLFVAFPQFISQQPSNQFVPLGAMIVFSVLANPPPLNYQWWFEGRPLTNSPRVFGANSPNLQIVGAQPGDAGYYRCVVSNSCRVLNTWSASCDVGGPPVLTNNPVSQVAPFHSLVQFTVGATPPPLAYKWFRNDVQIPGANNPVLPLPPVERANVGVYHAVVLNNFGAVASERAQLQVTLTLDGSVRSGEEATDDTPSLTNALPKFTTPTLVFHGVPLLFSTYDATAETWESSRCGVLPAHSMWLRYYSPRKDDAVTISSEGSDFDTVLAVYTWNGSTNTIPLQLACDNNDGYDGRDSRLTFAAEADKNYYIAVDGEAGATGTARVQAGEIIRNPRMNRATGQFTLEMAGPYWFTTSLLSATNLLLPPQSWPSVRSMPATTNDWVLSYTNADALSDIARFYRAMVNTNSSPSNP